MGVSKHGSVGGIRALARAAGATLLLFGLAWVAAGCSESDTRPCTGGPGSPGCACTEEGGCGLYLVCSDGVCRDQRTPPSDPICYTPCREGTLVDGVFRECSPEGLLEGCVAPATCIDGTCVADETAMEDAEDAGMTMLADVEPPMEAALGACNDELDCPGHQTCIAGTCYSDCRGDDDCPGEQACVRHVCRMTCSGNDEESKCPPGSYCATVDGENGYCEQGSDTISGDQRTVPGSFGLSTDVLALSNIADSASFTIVNDTPQALEFSVRRQSHKEFDSEGTRTETAQPLFWLALGEGDIDACGELEPGEGGEPSDDADGDDAAPALRTLVAGGGGSTTIAVCHASNPDVGSVWTGELQVGNPRVGYRTLTLSYTSRPEGQWSGRIFYFANFGTDELDAWIEGKDDPDGAGIASVGNALIWRWDAMRRGQISLDNFRAAVQSSITGSWDFQAMRERCPEPSGACYPYDDLDGLESFTNDLEGRPVPSGVAELPFVMNLRADGESRLTGKVVSEQTLHYAGEPAITLDLRLPVEGCDERLTESCVNYIEAFEGGAVVGGRYYPEPGTGGCELDGFEELQTPWLVPGFMQGSSLDGTTGLRYRAECRDTLQPFTDREKASLNYAFAGSNPIPDGRSRRRSLELIDGLLINQEELLVLFKERFVEDGEAGDEPTVAHGLMHLARTPATLQETDFDGSEQIEERDMDRDLSPPVRCSEPLVKEVFQLDTLPESWSPTPSEPEQIDQLASALITGRGPGGTEPLLAEQVGEAIHYYCHETGQIDGGPGNDGSETATIEPCPPGSQIIYFALLDTLECGDQETIANLPCQADGDCEDFVYRELPTRSGCRPRLNPKWFCESGDYCDDENDRREGKRFYAAGATTSVFLPLHNTVDQAFRYKTAFVSRKNRNLGFVPSICDPDTAAVPYCYDPPAIEDASERVDCALSLYVNHSDAMSPSTRTQVRDYLLESFAVVDDNRDGFETLYSELSIMLGDDAFTAAFASRFDLAATRTRAFEGELFEADGINLSGVAGHEMHSLYLAVQYYQLTLDRFYALTPLLRTSMRAQREGNAAFGFITQQTVTAYFDRLIRASSQKSRAWSEIARRYQNFNQPDLARRVVERAYTATYMESVLITRLMHEVTRVVRAADVAQIELIIVQAQRMYKAALLDMRDVYGSIIDDVNFFGFPPDYIPFPALDPGDINAFEKLMAAAWESTNFARDKEERALAQSRDFDVDEESFQAELVGIRNNYENQLGEICGLFPDPAEPNRWYPAISTYAHLWSDLELLGDPCGAVGTGAVHESRVEQSIIADRIELAHLKFKNKREEIEIETDRMLAQCAEIQAGVELEIALQSAKLAFEETKRWTNVGLGIWERFKETTTKLKGTAQCVPPTGGTAISPGNCIQVNIAATIDEVSSKGYDITRSIADALLAVGETAIAGAEFAKAIAELEGRCNLAQIDSAAKIKVLELESDELFKEYHDAFKELALGESRTNQLLGEAARVTAEQQEAEQLAINIEAARNDPNVRIYKNDAVISADRSFRRALAAAYKATKVYEYYTSQSYARLENLFLIRMVQSGDFSLEEYLFELDGAYTEFEEAFGNPDTRVAIISLRDDIWGIERVDGRGQSFSEDQRTGLLHERLGDPTLLDSRGYISIPFRTDIDQLSPLTRNHKILHIEAEILGGDVGDTLGRIYLRQRGTGTVRAIDGEKIFYALPEKTAVVDTFFNGERFGVFSDDRVLRSERFRDLPYANTAWELLINQRDELVNQDINLQSLSDVRLYIYYTDFTEL